MAELSFQYRCGRCLMPFKNSGYVLSCADFLCEKCMAKYEITKTRKCPVCNSEHINVVKLTQPPSEVADMISNPAADIEKLFNLLKFQISHYKKVLDSSQKVIIQLEQEKQTLLRNDQRLREVLANKREDVNCHLLSRKPDALQWTVGNGNHSSFRRPSSATTWCDHIQSGTVGAYCTSISTRDNADSMHHNTIHNAPTINRVDGRSTHDTSSNDHTAHSTIQPPIPSPNRPHSSSSQSGIKRPRTPGDSKDNRGILSHLPSPGNQAVKRPHTTGSTRLRSPYLPYIRTPGGKSVNLSRGDIA